MRAQGMRSCRLASITRETVQRAPAERCQAKIRFVPRSFCGYTICFKSMVNSADNNWFFCLLVPWGLPWENLSMNRPRLLTRCLSNRTDERWQSLSDGRENRQKDSSAWITSIISGKNRWVFGSNVFSGDRVLPKPSTWLTLKDAVLSGRLPIRMPLLSAELLLSEK